MSAMNARCTVRPATCTSTPFLTVPSRPCRNRNARLCVRAAKGKGTPQPQSPVESFPPPAVPDATPADAAATSAVPDWATAPQPYYYQQQQPMYYAPPPPPPPPPSTTPFGLPWWAFLGVGVLVANIGAKLLQFANPQKVQEMAMQQMMKQMMNQAGMKPPAGVAAANPFGFPAGFPSPPGGPGGAPPNPWGTPGGGFPGMTPPVDVTATTNPTTASTQAASSSASSSTKASGPSGAGTVEATVAEPATATAASSSSFFRDVDSDDNGATTAAPNFATNYFEQQAGAPAQAPSVEDPAAKEEKAAAMLASMEVMMEDPKMVEMMAPYLPEAFRDPVAFKAVLKDPVMRKQVIQQFSQMDMNFDPTQMQQMMSQYNVSTPEAMQQMQQMGLNPQELLSEMMNDPEIMVLFQNPKIQKAVMEISQNPMAMVNYQGDPDVLKVMMKINNIVGPKMAGGAVPGMPPPGMPAQPVQQ